MPFDFPDAPTVNQEVTAPGGAVYAWNGTRWVAAGQSTAYMPLAGDSTKDGALTVTGALAAGAAAAVTGALTVNNSVTTQGPAAGYKFTDKANSALTYELTSENNYGVIKTATNPTAFSMDSVGNIGCDGNLGIRGTKIFITESIPQEPTLVVANDFTYLMAPGAGQSVACIMMSGAAAGFNTYYRNESHNFQSFDGLIPFAIFNAVGTYNASGAWTVMSDETVKENVAPYQRGLDAIRGLSPVTYNYKAGTPFADENNTSYVGFIAQDLEKVAPEFVSENEFEGLDGMVKTTTPSNLIYPLINAVQELLARIEELEKKK